ncbi:cation diffusion facilitator family transporter [soil metagenome]
MSKSCCEAKSSELSLLRTRQASVLKWVLAINALMFFLEFAYGWVSHSSGLMADSLDMLGDAVVYGFSLYVLDRGARWRARAGLLKGVVMAVFGVVVLSQVAYRFTFGIVPDSDVMGIIAVVALAANATCLFLLYRHRSDDINMRSTWLCSRNDIVANVGVILASILVGFFHSVWPDTLVGLIISALFLKSAYEVVIDARNELSTVDL